MHGEENMKWAETAMEWNTRGCYCGRKVDLKQDGNDEDGMADMGLVIFWVVSGKT
jgi:hypothetical protein